MQQPRPSIESVLSILSNFSDDGPKDRDTTHRLVRDAKTLIRNSLTGEKLKGKVLADELLCALLDYAPHEQGQRYVASAILNETPAGLETRRDYLIALADVWLTHMLFPVKAAGHARKSTPSGDQTPTYEETATLVERATRADQTAFRALLLRRQGYKCAVTGAFSWDAPSDVAKDYPVTAVTASHILPFSLNDFKGNDAFKKAVITWDMIKSWTAFDIIKVAGEKINGAANGILLRCDLDSTFEDFRWWFEPAGETQHCYKIVSKRFMGYNDNTVTFLDDSEKNIDLPDPEILALHAAFCNVFSASAAGAYYDTIYRDSESLRGLATDGSTDIFLLVSMLISCTA